MSTALLPVELPEWSWQRPEVRAALTRRDVAAIFRAAQQYSGASQARLAAAVGMTQGRVNEVINGRREVSRLDVFERIADGLTMSDHARHLLGLASSRTHRSGGQAFDLAAFPEVVRVYASQAATATEIQRQARSAASVDILAVRGLGLIGLNDSLLRTCLTRDDTRVTVRVLLLDPRAPAVAVRAAEIGESVESLAGGIAYTEARLRELSDVCDISVHWYRHLPTWRIIRLDSVLYVSVFHAGWEGHESAIYKVMETPHGPLYRGFRRMYDAMVEDSDRVV
ncbi:helix-turn-helix domain-containing protein [Peterkaempfera bronchialis]|uniref:XRE family transcriptional regulator n=1 Tax=Peterkaempfera bronchialis TaxID=2126346 RepID=A0A345SXE6_9ACTN|nr:helix-turn-helix transcriptional regulator [Peterkaempfera bronchialis]AXI78401.1 XRE family transcriptional regulator [Peterkaempfera bronchialis]